MYGYRADDSNIPIPEMVPASPHFEFRTTEEGQDSMDWAYERRDVYRRPVSSSTGLHTKRAASPKPDVPDQPSLGSGGQYRLCRNKELITARGLSLAARTVAVLIASRKAEVFPETRLVPSEEELESWLKKTTYGDGRKEELRAERENVGLGMVGEGDNATKRRNMQNFVIKMFAKEEHYTQYKHFRGIYARNDPSKVLFGHWVSKVEKVVYKWPEFIKKVPIHERPELLSKMFPEGAEAAESDYSSWEGHFNILMMALEKLIFGIIMTGIDPDLEYFDRWVTKNHKIFRGAKELSDLIKIKPIKTAKLFPGIGEKRPDVELLLDVFFDHATSTVNHCSGKRVSMLCHCLRMSGEMTTSVLNGLMNLVFYYTIAAASNAELDPNKRGNYTEREYAIFEDALLALLARGRNAVVEGDDLLARLLKGDRYDETWYKVLGLKVKFERFSHWSHASFCGMRCDPESLQIICDIRKVLGTYGWVAKRYATTSTVFKKKLAKVKALSYAYQYPGCPILNVLAHKTLEWTKDLNVKRLLTYEDAYGGKWKYRHVYKHVRKMYESGKVPFEEPTQSTRDLFAKINGVSVEQQLAAEEYLMSIDEYPDGLDLLDYIDFESDVNGGADQIHFWNNYVFKGCGDPRILASSHPIC